MTALSEAAEKAIAEWDNARERLKRCCDVLIVQYEPGCSFVQCSGCGRKVAVPDWDPEGMVEAWNA